MQAKPNAPTNPRKVMVATIARNDSQTVLADAFRLAIGLVLSK